MDISQTPLFCAYLHELVWLSQSIVSACDAVFEEARVPESGFVIQVSARLHGRISSAILASANLKKLVEASHKRKSESADAHGFRQRRAKALRAVLDGLDLDEVLNSKVRNSLEHFDEYLDEENRRLADGGSPQSPMAAYNMTLSDWKAVSPPVYPIRLYVSSERKFYNMKTCVDLQKLRNQAAAIVARLTGHLETASASNAGGLMIPLQSGERANPALQRTALARRR